MLKKNRLFKLLNSLHLPVKDYAIFGSGPLYVRNIRSEIQDLDIIARGQAWKKVEKLGKITNISGNHKVVLFNGMIEIFDNWGPGDWNIDDLIDSSVIYEGLNFVTLENVYKWKKQLQRPKDLIDIINIEKYWKLFEKPNQLKIK